MAYDYQDGFTFGEDASSSLSLIVIDKEIPLMPEIEDQGEELPGLDGGYDFGIRYKPKIIPVKVRLLNSISKLDYKNKLRSLASKLNPRLGTKALIFDDEPDKMYFGRLSDTFSPLRMGLISDEFTLSFICYDPFTYSVAEKDLSGATQITAVQSGSHVSRPLLIITKDAGGAKIRNTRNDGTTEEIVFSSDSPAGVYEIDCKEQTSTIDGDGAYQFLDEERYFTLQEGSNVVSRVSGAVTNMRLIYRDTWL